jgi:signal transduction histidine kinase
MNVIPAARTASMEISHDFASSGVTAQFVQLEGLFTLYQRALGHDLPNQLVSIQGFARMVETDLPASTQAETRTRIGRVADLARKADEQMRALANIGRTLCSPPSPERIDLGELVHEAAIETRLVFNTVPVEYHFSVDAPVLTTVRVPLYRVVSELLRNSFQAVADRRLVIDLAAGRGEAGSLVLRVSDNGRGMNDTMLRQVEATLAGRPAGTMGLGLVFVRLALAGWGGAIRIRSEPEQGTAITLIARALTPDP